MSTEDNVQIACEALTKQMIEKNDWNTATFSADVKSMVQATLQPVADHIKNRTLALSGQYNGIVALNKNATDDLKKQLLDFFGKMSIDSASNIDDMMNGYYNFFGVNVAARIDELRAARALANNADQIANNTQRVRNSVLISCTSILHAMPGESVETEQSMQGELSHSKLFDPAYKAIFMWPVPPDPYGDLQPDESALVTANSVSAAVPAVIRLATDEMQYVIENVFEQINTAHTMGQLNLKASTLSADVIASRLTSIDDLFHKLSDSLKKTFFDFKNFLDARQTEKVENCSIFAGSISLHSQDVCQQAIDMGEQYFKALTPLITNLSYLI